jgi:hypothetical protein
VLPILKIFNDLLTFSAVIINFRWRDLGSDTLGECSPDGLIHMSPTALDIQENSHNYTEYVLHMQSRLGTLLREMIHAYLFQFACEECPPFNVNIRNADDHSRASRTLQVHWSKCSLSCWVCDYLLPSKVTL